MKYLLSLLFLVNGYCQVLAPVKWSYGLKKLSKNLYELHLKASIENDWHVYSQVQPKNAIAQKTIIKFKENDGISLVGKTKELGKPEKFYDQKMDIGATQYEHTVDFVQIIRVKGKKPDSISGTITFQACKSTMCLPAEDVAFTIPGD